MRTLEELDLVKFEDWTDEEIAYAMCNIKGVEEEYKIADCAVRFIFRCRGLEEENPESLL